MRYWIDVTDLMAWRGHLTGIQRVVYNYAVRLQRDKKEVYFFYYDAIERNFYRVDIQLKEWLESNNQSGHSTSVTLKEKIRSKIPYKILNTTPQKVKSFTLKVGKFVVHNSKKHLHKRTNKGNNNQLVSFQKNDIVMVLGNGWDNKNILEDLGKKKQKRNFYLINVVYDLIPIFEPQFFGGLVTEQYTNYIFEAITNCDLLLPISKSTERDIIRFCEMIESPIPKTKVIRLGDEINQDEAIEKPAWLDEDDNFILCVGTIEVRKNHMLLYYAYKEMVNAGHAPPKLIIAGKRGWYTADVLMLFEQDESLNKYVVIAENTRDSELAWLYEHCMFTIYPSLYEGWGLPVAESLARGKVVLCSNSSSVPEAGGKLAIYFSPYDPLGCSGLIQKYYNRETLSKKEYEIKSQYKINSWEDYYKNMTDIIEKWVQ